MNQNDRIKKNQQRLNKRYKQLIEQAYNFRQTDSAISDISEFQAIKLLNKINRLKYLNRGEPNISIP
ncbi:Lacal_2735 family protein [Formosa sp. A9]|uniref:Lacal_2735 family protein n=1 Tax=Formosa sp. A9 TaxID=3442641 RepID=UPI003EBFD5CD